jgi:ABC-type Fe3+/spermidine/putrescine transport system ATPase subunit
MAIVGKSGSGKTTLLKCIYGLEDLVSGHIQLDEEAVLGPAYNLIAGHEDMKLVSQEYYVLENHTVEENIFDKLIGYTTEAKQKRSKKLLQLLELEPLRNTRAKHLSSGQRQRVAIARALAIIPKVLLLDEPFSNLDTILSEKLFSFIIKEVKQQRTSVILITHLAEEALKYADTIGIMDEGRLLQTGEKWQVYYHPRNSRLAGLLGDYNLIRKSDLSKKSAALFPSKFVIRPDQLQLQAGSKAGDINLTVTNCLFNGKCYEIYGLTSSGNRVVLYAQKSIALNKAITCNIRQV